MSEKAKQAEPERITVLAREFPPAALEFHRRRMGERGFTVEGAITPHKFLMLEGAETPKELFNGEALFAVTFVRKKD